MGEVEGGRVRLAALELRHPLLALSALQLQVQQHYLRAALPELVKLFGSAALLGRFHLPLPASLKAVSEHPMIGLHPCRGSYCAQACLVSLPGMYCKQGVAHAGGLEASHSTGQTNAHAGDLTQICL